MIKERSGHTVMHSVREDNQHAEGVAIIKSKSSLMVGMEATGFNSNFNSELHQTHYPVSRAKRSETMLTKRRKAFSTSSYSR